MVFGIGEISQLVSISIQYANLCSYLFFQAVEHVEVEYVAEKLDQYEGMNEEFRKIFEKFAFTDVAASEVMSWSWLFFSHYNFSVILFID